MRSILLLFTLLFPLFSSPEGFGGDTQVLTPDGYVAIKTLSAGDYVVCFDPSTVLRTDPSTALRTGSEQDSFAASTVFGVFKYSSQSFDSKSRVIILSVGEEKIIAAEGQKFFSAGSMDWVDAENIVVGDKLLSFDGKDVEVVSVEVYSEPHDLYKVSVADYSNFFVTSKNILVHNFFYNAVIEAVSAAATRVPPNISSKVCNGIVSAVSKAMPIIERIFVAAFSAFLIKHRSYAKTEKSDRAV